MHKQENTFYGTATVGEKGQVVIPCDAREALGIEKGEKLLVFGMGDDALVIARLSNVTEIADHLADKLAHIRKALDTASQ